MLSTLRFHPDGKRIAYTVQNDEEDAIWVMENFLPAVKAAR
jgi:Tol biopolymer transport system component